MALVQRHAGHDMGGMDMGGTKMVSGPQLQQYFWVFIGSVIAFATLLNLVDYLHTLQRLRSKSAKPRSLFWVSFATLTAVTRELYSTATPTFHVKGIRLRSPLLGQAVIVVAYLIAVVVLSLYGQDTTDKWSWEDVAVQIGYVQQAQFPLIFLLAGKQNIIGFLTGIGYERLSWLHRWVARVLWIGVTMHMGFFFRSWIRWNYVIVKLKEDNMTQTGFAAWWLLTAIVALSFAPVRRWQYEFFVMSHIVLFAGLLGAVMIHVDSGSVYIWLCVGFYFFDRLVRFVVACFCNLSFLHFRKGLWANKATLTTLPGNVTRITIENPVVSWKAGQHAFLSCHSVVPLQSHPFTIASLPSDRKLEFLVQARKGGTRRFHRYASRIQQRLPNVTQSRRDTVKHVGVEGPYGSIRPLHQFDSVVLVAGGLGSTFVVPLLRDLIYRKTPSDSDTSSPVRVIRLVWAVKSSDRLIWFRDQLTQALKDAQHLGLVLDIYVYVTCDEELASSSNTPTTDCDLDKTCAGAEMVTSQDGLITTGVPLDQKKETGFKESIRDLDDGSSCEVEGGKTCCCKTTVEDEDEPPTQCCCTRGVVDDVVVESKPGSSSASSSSSTGTTKLSEKVISLDKDPPKSGDQSSQPQIRIMSGRPHCRNIVRRVLEDAEGESAVVVCGPQGLRDDVRRSVVGLSDERAVHKGTGAQGIYLHVEGFEY